MASCPCVMRCGKAAHHRPTGLPGVRSSVPDGAELSFPRSGPSVLRVRAGQGPHPQITSHFPFPHPSRCLGRQLQLSPGEALTRNSSRKGGRPASMWVPSPPAPLAANGVGLGPPSALPPASCCPVQMLKIAPTCIQNPAHHTFHTRHLCS